MAVTRATTFLLLGALASGAAAAYFTNDYIQGRIESYQQKIDDRYKPVKVVVPRHGLHTGDMLTYADLAQRAIPKAFVLADSIKPGNAGSVVGRRLRQGVNAGEPLLLSHVAKKRGPGFSNLITEGKRALTFPVDLVSSMSGLLRPGDRIDLLATLHDGSDSRTLVLLRNVTILATGGAVDEFSQPDDKGRYQTITLLVDPEDAAKITQAREVGTLTVTLRAPDDKKLAYVRSVTLRTLLGKERRKKAKHSVEIILGGVK